MILMHLVVLLQFWVPEWHHRPEIVAIQCSTPGYILLFSAGYFFYYFKLFWVLFIISQS